MSEVNKRKRLSGFHYRTILKTKKEIEGNLIRKTTILNTFFKINVI